MKSEVSHLVGDEQHRLVDAAQAAGDLLVEGHQAVAGIDDEQDQVGLVDGDVDLAFDVAGQIVDVLDAHAAGVDDFEVAIADLDGCRQAIAGHAGRGIDDGDAPARQPIEERRFADVGPDPRWRFAERARGFTPGCDKQIDIIWRAPVSRDSLASVRCIPRAASTSRLTR